jgi:HlyD family secretion protein
MTANVSVVIAHKDNVLQIKNAALRYHPADAAAAPAPQPRPASSPGAGGQRPTGARERRADRTVYVLSFGRPKPVQIKTGISDGIVTEVTEGLKEGDSVVTAQLSAPSAASSPGTNPFSSARRFP